MPFMSASVSTTNPSRLINRLCKHFSHKIEAEWSETSGFLTFSIGECQLSSENGALTLVCESPTAEELEDLGKVVSSHLIGFAGEEVAEVNWQPGSA
ncbi:MULTISPECIES: DUF2218 domain-containing protein [unclassified Marinobacter]|uniref:DUF2218 domain-containing protein n=1 Tax=unclassified Marinobacter TaxID=83889 RepID=UPI00190439DA|nr:DUF2218 domain-containing protein [Marinobacter sp. DY40_1A1]MBK1886341.1 DUF2218 domain-containing protein [Marinobacter sp. DY40_1A1]